MPVARTFIPDAWAEQGKCIWCGEARLQVQHPVGMPDQIYCSFCQFGYEVDRSSALLHICSLPESMPSGYQDSWLPAAKIIEEAKLKPGEQPKQRIEIPAEEMTYRGRETVADSESGSNMQLFKKAESARRVKLTEEEVFEQVRELYALGNSYHQIKKVLNQRYRFTEEAFQKAIAPILQEQERQKDLAWKKSLILLVVVIVSLVALGIIYRWLLPIVVVVFEQQLTLFGFSS